MEFELVWRLDKYKFRNACVGYINNVRVAVIFTHHSGCKFDGKLLLPGLPKGADIRSHTTLQGAQDSMQRCVNGWFEKVLG